MHGEIQAYDRAHEQHYRITEMKTHCSKTRIVQYVLQRKDTNKITHLSSSYKHRHSGFKDVLKITGNLNEDHLTLLTSSIHQMFILFIVCMWAIVQLTVQARCTDSAGRCIVKILRVAEGIPCDDKHSKRIMKIKVKRGTSQSSETCDDVTYLYCCHLFAVNPALKTLILLNSVLLVRCRVLFLLWWSTPHLFRIVQKPFILGSFDSILWDCFEFGGTARVTCSESFRLNLSTCVFWEWTTWRKFERTHVAGINCPFDT